MVDLKNYEKEIERLNLREAKKAVKRLYHALMDDLIDQDNDDVSDLKLNDDSDCISFEVNDYRTRIIWLDQHKDYCNHIYYKLNWLIKRETFNNHEVDQLEVMIKRCKRNYFKSSYNYKNDDSFEYELNDHSKEFNKKHNRELNYWDSEGTKIYWEEHPYDVAIISKRLKTYDCVKEDLKWFRKQLAENQARYEKALKDYNETKEYYEKRIAAAHEKLGEALYK